MAAGEAPPPPAPLSRRWVDALRDADAWRGWMRWWGRRGAFLGLDPSRSPCRPRVRQNLCVEGLADAPRKHRFVPGGEVGAVATEDAGRDGETFLLAMRGTGVSLSGLPAREWMDVLDRLLAAIEASASWHGQGGQGRFAVTALREGSVEPVIAALDAYAGPRLRGFVAEMKAGEEHRFLGRERDAAEAIARFGVFQQCLDGVGRGAPRGHRKQFG